MELARYLERRGELSKPWMLQLRKLTKLKEKSQAMDPQDYWPSAESPRRPNAAG